MNGLTQSEIADIERKVLEEVPVTYDEILFCAERKRSRKDTRELLKNNMIRDAIKQKASMTKNIFGSNVEMDHPDIQKAKTADDIKKLGIFDDLDKEMQHEACEEVIKQKNSIKKKE